MHLEGGDELLLLLLLLFRNEHSGIFFIRGENSRRDITHEKENEREEREREKVTTKKIFLKKKKRKKKCPLSSSLRLTIYRDERFHFVFFFLRNETATKTTATGCVPKKLYTDANACAERDDRLDFLFIFRDWCRVGVRVEWCAPAPAAPPAFPNNGNSTRSTDDLHLPQNCTATKRKKQTNHNFVSENRKM